MEPQIIAAFYLNKITVEKFELIYSKFTFIEALRELKNDGSAVQFRISLVNFVNLQALMMCLDGLNDDPLPLFTVYEQVSLHIMDGKDGTGDMLERPPHGQATRKGIHYYFYHYHYYHHHYHYHHFSN